MAWIALGAPQSYATEAIHGVVRAVNQATISTELNARVVAINFKEGERFAKGDLLIAFDCDKYRADMRAALADQSLYETQYKTAVVLGKHHAAGTLEIVESEAKFAKSKAISDGISAKTQECERRAPFSGVMGDVQAHAEELSIPNQPLFKIFDSSAVEIELIVPSVYIAWLKPGSPFSVHVNETGDDLDASVTRIAGTVDPVSQTVKIMGAFTKQSDNVLPGMSLTASLKRLTN